MILHIFTLGKTIHFTKGLNIKDKDKKYSQELINILPHIIEKGNIS